MAPLVAQLVKNPPAMPETWVPSLCWEGPLEKGMTYPYSKTSYNVSISRMGNLASKRLYNVAGTYFPTFPPSTLILIPQPLHLVFFCQTNYSTKSESESEVAQSCPTLCDPMDCTLPGSSIHGIFQARILEWVAISFSRGCSRPRDQTQVSCIVGRHFTV